MKSTYEEGSLDYRKVFIVQARLSFKLRSLHLDTELVQTEFTSEFTYPNGLVATDRDGN